MSLNVCKVNRFTSRMMSGSIVGAESDWPNLSIIKQRNSLFDQLWNNVILMCCCKGYWIIIVNPCCCCHNNLWSEKLHKMIHSWYMYMSEWFNIDLNWNDHWVWKFFQIKIDFKCNEWFRLLKDIRHFSFSQTHFVNKWMNMLIINWSMYPHCTLYVNVSTRTLYVDVSTRTLYINVSTRTLYVDVSRRTLYVNVSTRTLYVNVSTRTMCLGVHCPVLSSIDNFDPPQCCAPLIINNRNNWWDLGLK